MADVIYAPLNVKRNDRVQFFCLNASCKAEKLIAFINEHKNAEGFINLQIKEKRQPDQYGNTHSVTLNAWTKPQDSGVRQAEANWPKGKQQESNQNDYQKPPF